MLYGFDFDFICHVQPLVAHELKIYLFIYLGRGFFGIAPSRRYAPKCACAPEFAHICAMIDEATPSKILKILGYEHWNYLKEHAYQFNFELNRLKPKLIFVEKPENRVHKLTVTE